MPTDIVNIIEFLREKFKRGLSCNLLVSARSALGHCLLCDITNHSKASTFLQGVRNLRQPTSKYFAIWNVNTLLSHLQRKGISAFYNISKTLATSITNTYITDTEVTFTLDEVLKHTLPNYKQNPLIFRAFTSRGLCPVTTLNTYLEDRLPVSGDLTFLSLQSNYMRKHQNVISVVG